MRVDGQGGCPLGPIVGYSFNSEARRSKFRSWPRTRALHTRAHCYLAFYYRRTMALWTLLGDDERAHILTSATVQELARAAQLNRAWLNAVREERERRMPEWRHTWDSLQYNFDDYEDIEDILPTVVMPMAAAAARGDNRVLQSQIESGINVDFYDYRLKRSPLMTAVRNGHAACVRALLLAGARLDSVGGEPFIFELAIQHGRLEVVQLLTELGMPRWGKCFSCVDDVALYGVPSAEAMAADAYTFGPSGEGPKCTSEQLHQIHEFLVSTRKFNPRAGDPVVYTRLMVKEQAQLLAIGNEEEQRAAVRTLNALCLDLRDHGAIDAMHECAHDTLTTLAHEPESRLRQEALDTLEWLTEQ